MQCMVAIEAEKKLWWNMVSDFLLRWITDRLKFPEFEEMQNQVIYVSATPADYELEKSGGIYTEQIIRPTGL